MQSVLVACLFLGFTCITAADEAEDVWKLMEQGIRERAGSEALAERLLVEARIVQKCGLEHPEHGLAVLRKMFVKIGSEGTECVRTKSGIADAAERVIAIKKCWTDVADHAKASIPLTEEEAVVFDTIRVCVVKGLEALKE
ncbi:uncharacterized protein LOC119431165 [Dermacentor silvarum]|uniref:uncharacterized protein LOC119431165 n=1 Tax=Dermacentor silvarum TaxID=543639 RepID=UPI0018994B9C|nr:uncharacterized protein LOC119431165 [Dermacentor silvarum]